MKKIVLMFSLFSTLSCFAEPFQLGVFAAYFTSSENAVQSALNAVQKKDVAVTCAQIGSLAEGGKYGVSSAMAFIDSNSKPIPGLPAHLDVPTIATLVGKVYEENLRAYNANAFCKINLGVTDSYDGAVKPGNWVDLKIKLIKIQTVLKEIASIVQ
ncbi:MAG: hypothetical protein U0T83_10490 [Bacteriovoracaceae bacterium]